MNENKIQCPGCGNMVENSLTYCDACGMQIQKLCPGCDHMHSAATQFCPTTGKSLTGKTMWNETGAIITSSFKTLATRWAPGTAALVLGLMFLGAFAAMYFSGFSLKPQWNISIERVQVPRIDVVFAIDTTGSMSDEIQTVKEKIKNMARDIKSGRPSPDVRFGLVAFRDRGDDYVVKSFPFTRDIQGFSSLVNALNADGGGDTPESVNEALDVAVNKMNWERGQGTQKLVFLIGDAGPHTDYANSNSYDTIARQAGQKGISIYSIGCSGIDSFGQEVFRQVAGTTGGSFEFLTYQVAYRAPTGETRYMLNAGGRSYSIDERSIKDDSWRRGASEMTKSGAAKDAMSMPGRAGECESASRMVSSGAARNNLDSIMTNVIKCKAEKAGVKY
jgi:Mg-chelatase subunit ChlD